MVLGHIAVGKLFGLNDQSRLVGTNLFDFKFFDLINAKCLVGHEEAKQSEDVKTYNILVSLNPVSTRVGV